MLLTWLARLLSVGLTLSFLSACADCGTGPKGAINDAVERRSSDGNPVFDREAVQLVAQALQAQITEEEKRRGNRPYDGPFLPDSYFAKRGTYCRPESTGSGYDCSLILANRIQIYFSCTPQWAWIVHFHLRKEARGLMVEDVQVRFLGNQSPSD